MDNLDLQLQEIQNKLLQIQALQAKREQIKHHIEIFSGEYDPINNPSSMMNPLSMLNFALSNEQIQILSEQVISELAVKLV